MEKCAYVTDGAASITLSPPAPAMTRFAALLRAPRELLIGASRTPLL